MNNNIVPKNIVSNGNLMVAIMNSDNIVISLLETKNNKTITIQNGQIKIKSVHISSKMSKVDYLTILYINNLIAIYAIDFPNCNIIYKKQHNNIELLSLIYDVSILENGVFKLFNTRINQFEQNICASITCHKLEPNYLQIIGYHGCFIVVYLDKIILKKPCYMLFDDINYGDVTVDADNEKEFGFELLYKNKSIICTQIKSCSFDYITGICLSLIDNYHIFISDYWDDYINIKTLNCGCKIDHLNSNRLINKFIVIDDNVQICITNNKIYKHTCDNYDGDYNDCLIEELENVDFRQCYLKSNFVVLWDFDTHKYVTNNNFINVVVVLIMCVQINKLPYCRNILRMIIRYVHKDYIVTI